MTHLQNRFSKKENGLKNPKSTQNKKNNTPIHYSNCNILQTKCGDRKRQKTMKLKSEEKKRTRKLINKELIDSLERHFVEKQEMSLIVTITLIK